MRNSKLLQIIGSFSKDELKRFRLFIYSPYFVNGRKQNELQQLFEHIQKYWPQLDHEDLSKANTYREIYSEEEIIGGKLEKLMGRLLLILRQFIAQRELENHQTEHQDLIYQIDFFRKNKLTNLVEITSNKLKQSRANKTQHGLDYFFETFQMERQIVDDARNFAIFDSPTNMPAVLRSLDDFFLVAKLNYTIQLLAMNDFIVPIDITKSLQSLQLLLPLVRQKKEEIPIIKIYYYAYLILQAAPEERAASFDQFREALDTYLDVLPEDTQKEMLTLIRNYCIRQYYLGDSYFLKITLPLYQEHLEKGYLYYQGKLLPSALVNLITASLQEKKFELAKFYLDTYQHRIAGTNYPEEVYRYCLLFYYTVIGEFDLGLELLQQPFEDRFLKASSRQLEIRILYDMESELLDARLDAFKIYIHRLDTASFPQKNKKRFRNFVDLLRQIRSSTNVNHPERIKKLREKAISTEYLASRHWLIEKIEEM